MATIRPAAVVFREEQNFDWWVYALIAVRRARGRRYLLGLAHPPLGPCRRAAGPSLVDRILARPPWSAWRCRFLLVVCLLRMTTEVTPTEVRVWFGWVPTYRRVVPIADRPAPSRSSVPPDRRLRRLGHPRRPRRRARAQRPRQPRRPPRPGRRHPAPDRQPAPRGARRDDRAGTTAGCGLVLTSPPPVPIRSIRFLGVLCVLFASLRETPPPLQTIRSVLAQLRRGTIRSPARCPATIPGGPGHVENITKPGLEVSRDPGRVDADPPVRLHPFAQCPGNERAPERCQHGGLNEDITQGAVAEPFPANVLGLQGVVPPSGRRRRGIGRSRRAPRRAGRSADRRRRDARPRARTLGGRAQAACCSARSPPARDADTTACSRPTLIRPTVCSCR